MPQTMLALLALMIATLFAVQQQRQGLHARASAVRNSLALHATGVVEDKLGQIGATAFDEATTGDEANTRSELTAPGELGGTESSDEPDDIDDFHATVAEEERVIQRKNPETGLLEAHTLRFGVEIKVTYANEDGVPQTTQTEYKKATAWVYSKDITPSDTVKLSRLYACGSKCTF